MATITQLQQTILTPAVTKLITEPLPSNLPPPPPGMGYEVVPTSGGGAVRTGKLVPTGKTTPEFYQGSAFQQFTASLGVVLGVGGGELLASSPVWVQKAAPLLSQNLQTGRTPTWGSGMTSSAASQDFLTRLVSQQRTKVTGLVTSALTRQISSLPLPPMIQRLMALRR